ncbi:hypothetical protein SRHO_G00127780 [Serrasalmus rhombeus]
MIDLLYFYDAGEAAGTIGILEIKTVSRFRLNRFRPAAGSPNTPEGAGDQTFASQMTPVQRCFVFGTFTRTKQTVIRCEAS